MSVYKSICFSEALVIIFCNLFLFVDSSIGIFIPKSTKFNFKTSIILKKSV